MAEVGGRLIGIFADNLAAMLAAEQAPGAGGRAAEGAAAEAGTPRAGQRAWRQRRRGAAD